RRDAAEPRLRRTAHRPHPRLAPRAARARPHAARIVVPERARRPRGHPDRPPRARLLRVSLGGDRPHLPLRDAGARHRHVLDGLAPRRRLARGDGGRRRGGLPPPGARIRRDVAVRLCPRAAHDLPRAEGDGRRVLAPHLGRADAREHPDRGCLPRAGGLLVAGDPRTRLAERAPRRGGGEVTRLDGRTALVGVTGGIACYKSCEIVRLLVGAGAQVRVVMTAAAREFVTPLTLQTLSGHPVATDTFDLTQE